jgi:hypothetical protein
MNMYLPLLDELTLTSRPCHLVSRARQTEVTGGFGVAGLGGPWDQAGGHGNRRQRSPGIFHAQEFLSMTPLFE